MFGLYIHIPYCLQRCSYCDFATYVYDQILPPEEYVKLLIKELRQKALLFPNRPLTSIYFGGGTPSLLSSDLILSILDEIGKTKLLISPETEITLEINPATLDIPKIRHLLSGGVNRFSVGAQTFNDALLKGAGRKHSSEDTIKTLDLLRSEDVNYSFDLLFALPKQTLQDLEEDLEKISEIRPPHLSAYCLTVPTGHPMSYNRPTDDHQVEMFNKIYSALGQVGLERYEISNFARPGKESKHNLLYWQDGEYLGLGLSAHSYLKNHHPWGARFWNPSSVEAYQKLMQDTATEPLQGPRLENNLGEVLDEKSSLFDFCHTALRLDAGLEKNLLNNRYSQELVAQMENRLQKLMTRGLVLNEEKRWRLSPEGVLVSNYVFSEIAL
jgi:oxygen-independent coproporphyrinogen III oxidase